MTVSVLIPHLQNAVAGELPIIPIENSQLGEGVGLTVVVGDGLAAAVPVGDAEGDGVTVDVTEGLAPMLMEGDGEAVAIEPIGVGAGGAIQANAAPSEELHDSTIQPTVPAQSFSANVLEIRHTFGHGRAQVNPLSGVAKHVLTAHGEAALLQSRTAKPCAP